MDATEKADAAQAKAIATAAEDASNKADAAQSAAITAAAKDAQTKADAAKNAAISAAATDAATKAAQALADAKEYTDDEITVVSNSLSTATADISVLKDQIALKVEQTDIDEAVAEVNGKFASYSTTSQMNAAITAAKDSITSSVSKTYATKTELNTASGKISALETWKTEASQKITKDGIISTVGNYYAYETDLTKAENRISSAESKITQNASGITVALQNAEEAAKTATNFLKFESSGLIVGDMTGDTLGNNILIDSESINFRHDDKILAKYTSDSIRLGADSMNTTINFGGVFDIVTEPNIGDEGRAYLSHHIDNKLNDDIHFSSIGVEMSSFAQDSSYNYAQVRAQGLFGNVRLLTRSGNDSEGAEKHADIELEAEYSRIRLLARSGVGSGGSEKHAGIEVEAKNNIIKMEADTILLANNTKITTDGIELNDGDIIINGSSLNSKLNNFDLANPGDLNAYLKSGCGISIRGAQSAPNAPNNTLMGIVITYSQNANWGFQWYLSAYGDIKYRVNQNGSISSWATK